MSPSSANVAGTPATGTLAHLWKAISRLPHSELGHGDDVRERLIRIAHMIFLICAYFGRGPERVRVECIFGIDIHTIARRLGVPASPQLITEATEALHLLRRFAISLGCRDGGGLAVHTLVCPSKQANDWVRWAAAYLQQGIRHVSGNLFF
ncbi:MAG: hypothetical protein ACLP00_01585 [Terracidiphilus sp.]